jgi:hypothetical protein
MHTCAATCASVTPTGGDYFVFKGGVTWPAESNPVGFKAQRCGGQTHYLRGGRT